MAFFLELVMHDTWFQPVDITSIVAVCKFQYDMQHALWKRLPSNIDKDNIKTFLHGSVTEWLVKVKSGRWCVARIPGVVSAVFEDKAFVFGVKNTMELCLQTKRLKPIESIPVMYFKGCYIFAEKDVLVAKYGTAKYIYQHTDPFTNICRCDGKRLAIQCESGLLVLKFPRLEKLAYLRWNELRIITSDWLLKGDNLYFPFTGDGSKAIVYRHNYTQDGDTSYVSNDYKNTGFVIDDSEIMFMGVKSSLIYNTNNQKMSVIDSATNIKNDSKCETLLQAGHLIQHNISKRTIAIYKGVLSMAFQLPRLPYVTLYCSREVLLICSEGKERNHVFYITLDSLL